MTRSGLPSGATRSSGPATTYDVSIDAGWEVDLWGRVRNTVESNVAGAEAMGWDSLLVLTGVSTREDATASAVRPTFVADDLRALVGREAQYSSGLRGTP